VEIGAGAAVLAGVATPLSASAVVGTMAVAARSVHIPNGFFITAAQLATFWEKPENA
jgi:putative oxidoreductase